MADLTNYKCYKNNRFQVLTQDGFKNFKGLIIGENSQRVKIVLTSGKELYCTPHHKVLRRDESIAYASSLKVGDCLYGDYVISSLEELECNDPVYELLDVEDTHTYFANGILSHQCLIIDECAFIEPHLVDEFWKSVFPIISSSKKSKVFICSTANGTENLFFKLYRGAEEGTNGWSHDKIMWNEVPGRDEVWAAQTRQAIGSADAWQQEFCSCSEDTLVDIEGQGDMQLIDVFNEME